jgi:hypothetical protein
VRIEAASPVERVDLRRGAQTIATLRPYQREALGRRIRVIWEGAEYRGRGRMCTWDGRLEVTGNRIADFTPVNFLHLEKSLRRTQDNALEWESVTTGNFAGADILLDNASRGRLTIGTKHVNAALDIGGIGYEDTVYPAGGLGRQLRVFRLPDENPHKSFAFERDVEIDPSADSPIYVRVTLENGHQAWSSPIYFIPKR